MVDLPALIQGVVDRHKPVDGIAQWENEVLIIQFLWFRHLVRRVVILILIQQNPKADWKEVFQKASWMADTLSPPKFQTLYNICQNERPIVILIKTRLNAEYCAEELRRLKEKNVGWQFVQVLGGLATSEVLKGLQEKLKVDDMTTYHQDEEEDEDLKALALKSAFEAYEKMKERAGFPVPAMFIQTLPPDCGLPEIEPPPWDVLNAHILPLEWIEGAKMFLPILSGETEKLPNKAHDALGDHFEKWKAQKRKGERVPGDLTDLEEAGQLPWSHPSPPRAMSEMTLIYSQAEQRWGKKAIPFLDALMEGCTVLEASKKAGISRQTGHKYLRELQKDNKSSH